jgi:PPK2 family polyphosphate:nucleotide phosphotransferase
MFDRYCVKPDNKFKLSKIDPNDLGDWENKKAEGKQKLADLTAQLDKLQGMLYAESKHKILIVIQAMDTAGKDGTICGVFDGVNPQGVKVASFKVPTTPELAHDYLWRVHQVVPGKGELVIFNRSHYEDVLIVAVHNWIDAAECKRRYNQISEFERLLAEEGTTILKFFLHIDLETQRQRLIERIGNPEKQWKFKPGDLDERKLWPDYMKAYESAIKATSTEYAPWYVVPANRNWYRNLIVASVIVDTLKGLNMEYPKPAEDLTPYKQKLEAEAPATN